MREKKRGRGRTPRISSNVGPNSPLTKSRPKARALVECNQMVTEGIESGHQITKRHAGGIQVCHRNEDRVWWGGGRKHVPLRNKK